MQGHIGCPVFSKERIYYPSYKKIEPGIFTVKIPVLTGLFGKLTYLSLPFF